MRPKLHEYSHLLETMPKKIYVGNLSQSTTDQQLIDHFAKAGKVISASITLDKNSSKNMGNGYVNMSTDDETVKAIKTLNGSDLNGKKIRVVEAHYLDQEVRHYSYRRW